MLPKSEPEDFGSGKQQDANEFWNYLTRVIENTDKSLESLLLDNVLQVDIDGVDNEGWTALHRAAWNGQTNAIALLLSHQANPNSRTNESISGQDLRLLQVVVVIFLIIQYI